mmetsp:Transcript_14623/g.33883  ORF Transcript_14623/g.33883 Transcript_14623/m.33883 type:complete len:279 (+) Transcript_14623:131-967(+)
MHASSMPCQHVMLPSCHALSRALLDVVCIIFVVSSHIIVSYHWLLWFGWWFFLSFIFLLFAWRAFSFGQKSIANPRASSRGCDCDRRPCCCCLVGSIPSPPADDASRTSPQSIVHFAPHRRYGGNDGRARFPLPAAAADRWWCRRTPISGSKYRISGWYRSPEPFQRCPRGSRTIPCWRSRVRRVRVVRDPCWHGFSCCRKTQGILPWWAVGAFVGLLVVAAAAAASAAAVAKWALCRRATPQQIGFGRQQHCWGSCCCSCCWQPRQWRQRIHNRGGD